MRPKVREDNPLVEAAVGSTRRFLMNMDPGHNGPHVEEPTKIIVKALKDPY